MDNTSLITIIRLSYESELIPYQKALDEYGIEYFMADNIYASIAPFESDALGGIKIKVRKEDVEKAMQVIEEVKKQKTNPNQEIHDVDFIEDHYLNEYSLKELEEIVIEYDKWSPDDVSYAYMLLKKKGVSLTDKEIEAERNKRLNKLKETKEVSDWVFIGCYILAVLGGFLSVFFLFFPPILGWNYMVLKKNLPNGTKTYVYSEKTRKRGATLLLITSFIAIIWVVLILFFPEYVFSLLSF